MIDDYHSDDQIVQENERLRRELELLGRDGSVFDGLEPDEANVRLKKLFRYAEQENEARLLGKEPPQEFLDPTSPYWMPDVDDMVHRCAHQLLGEDFVLWPAELLPDDELKKQLHTVIDKLAEQGIGFAINETVPERIAYQCLVSELEEGLDVMPGLFIDGCDGCCEECFQLPYCETGRDLAKEYDFPVTPPSTPPRRTGSSDADDGARPYNRVPILHIDLSGMSGNDADEGDEPDAIPF